VVSRSFPSHHTMSNAKEARRTRFLDVFPVIRDELIHYMKQQGLPESAVEWYQRVSRSKISRCWFILKTRLQSMDYNVPWGKLNRGMAVVDTVEIMKGRSLTDDEYFKAAVLGWCVELVRFPLLSLARIMR
jgi:farnesyl diphosphate synthase